MLDFLHRSYFLHKAIQIEKLLNLKEYINVTLNVTRVDNTVNTTGVLRVDSKLKEEAKKVAKKRGLTLSKFTEEALESLIEEYGYDFESFMNLVKITPNLLLYQDIIEKELGGAPPKIIRDIMKLISEDKLSRFFKIKVSKEEAEKVHGLFSTPMRKLILIAKISSDNEDEIDKAHEKISEFVGEMNVNDENFKIILKRDFTIKETPELLAFVSYLKGEDKNGSKN